MTDMPAGRDLRLPEVLAEAFAAFEAIGRVARAHEDQAPELLAAFMSAACTAADGREAIAAAPVLAGGIPALRQNPLPGRYAGPAEAADAITALAGTVANRLECAAGPLPASSPDRHACAGAASAARQIRQLMAPADDSRLR